jgi:hypothetical protein
LLLVFGKAVLFFYGVRFFRAERGKTAHRRLASTMLPQANAASNVGGSVGCVNDTF